MTDGILTTAEIEHIIQNYVPCNLSNIGSSEWFRDTDRLCKLYQVSVIEVRTEGPERIKSALSVENRIGDFTKSLITVALWKEKVLPILLNFSPRPEHSFPIYIILYSEVMMVGLLEALLFHGEMFWDLGDMCIDLIDYAVETLMNISTKASFDCDLLPVQDCDALSEINVHRSKMKLTISASCITILRYVAENFDKMTLSAASRLYTNYDVPVIVANLLSNDTWSQNKGGKIFKYENNTWREWRADDPILSHLECQTWLLLRQLLLNPTCDTLYYYSDYRKDHLSKLIRLLYDSVIDQLSPLADLKIWIHRLSVSNYQQNNSSNPLIMEITESYRDRLLIEFDGKWEKLASDKALFLLYPKDADMKIIANFLSSSIDGMVLLDESIHSCNFCYAKALKRCSKCQKAWYCSRKCQVEHWKLHRAVCCQ